MPLAELIQLLVELGKDVLAPLVPALIGIIEAYRDGTLNAEEAGAAAGQQFTLMFGRMSNPHAEAAGVNAAVDAEATGRFKK